MVMAALLQDLCRDGSAHKSWSGRSGALSLSSLLTDAATVHSSPVSTPSFDDPILDVSPSPPPPSVGAVQLSDVQLLQRARAAQHQSRQQCRAFVPAFAVEGRSTTRFRWKRRKHSRNGFALFSRESSERAVDVEFPSTTAGVRSDGAAPSAAAAAGRGRGTSVACHQVLAVGDVRCGVRELAHILRSASDAELHALLRGLYESNFVAGSVVHVAALPSTSTTSAAVATGDALASQLAVKSLVFARSSFFTRDEQWCVVELFDFDARREAFTLTLGSLSDRDVRADVLTRPGEHQRSVARLRDVIADLTVEQVPGTASARVVYHSSFREEPSSSDNGSNNGSVAASVRASKARLLALAAGISRLPELVRRRRLGVQTLADCTVFAAPNARCACCACVLHMLSKKARCHLCGLAVCDRDWSIHEIETRGGRVSVVRVCTRCVDAVERCEYANVTLQNLARGVHVQRDGLELSPPQRQQDDALSSPLADEEYDIVCGDGLTAKCNPAAASSNSSSIGASLAALLTDALRNSTDVRKASVKTVIKHLVAADNEQRLSSATQRVTTTATTMTTTVEEAETMPLITLTDSSDETAYLSALDQYVRTAETVPLAQCVVANSGRRAYPLGAVRCCSGTDPLACEYPVPANEAGRLRVIAERDLMVNSHASEQLEIVCMLAVRELDCSISAVAIVGGDEQLILASNVDALRMVSMPRSESFCQHAVMAAEPLLVAHPEADVRFAHLPPLQQLMIRFYCGFPITSTSNAVVGTVCCLDTKTHTLTQSQYATMTRLAETASRIVRLREPAPTSTPVSCVHKLL